jgi:phage gpG-like protein
MTSIRVGVEGFGELAKELLGDTITEAAQEAVTESTALMLNRIRARFLEQVAPDGSHWEPSYAAFERSFNGRGGGTLFDTGTLFHSIQLYSVSPLEGAIGTDVPYAGMHNSGGGYLPKREFLGFSDEDESLALSVFMRKIEKAFQ